ncbi:MAG TPA: 6-phosphogluconate dehydrogenase (decarboxylating), partial [Coriobacteriia bacterium]|nr:6-phosphogluconate dehydrogenase (decarboxylating) [Coriobacteriia bacterium]
ADHETRAGARTGACLMIGGDKETFDRAEAVFADVAVPDGYRFFDGVGSGHFVKMVHNGIEYGMMQSIAEGFAVMHDSPRDLDLTAVADVYQHASVIESRLVGWLGAAYERFGRDLEPVSGTAGHTGEGAWTIETARAAGIPTPAIEAALQFRIDSEQEPSYTGQVVQALRNEFGGHGLSPKGSK